MIVLTDNYDSFSYNVYQLIGSVEPDIKVIRNDEYTVEEIEAMKPEALILSPGPGKPADAGVCIEAIRYFAGKLLSKWEGPYVIEEVYRSGAIKINNFEGTNPKVVNGQRIKHYISGNPINVETNVIETVTPEEYIRDTFQNVSDSEKE